MLYIPNPLLIYLYSDYFLRAEISYLKEIHFKLFLQFELITDNEDHLPVRCHLEVKRTYISVLFAIQKRYGMFNCSVVPSGGGK